MLKMSKLIAFLLPFCILPSPSKFTLSFSLVTFCSSSAFCLQFSLYFLMCVYLNLSHWFLSFFYLLLGLFALPNGNLPLVF